MHWLLLLLALIASAEASSCQSTCETDETINPGTDENEPESSCQSTCATNDTINPGTDDTTDPGTDATFCGKVPLKCEDSKYRSFDGSCNNLEHSWWGTPDTPYKRLRKSNSCGVEPIHNKQLPNPRFLSQLLYVDRDKKDQIWTLVFMQQGQLLAHDMSLTKGVAQTKKGAIECCTAGRKMPPEGTTNVRCAPIQISKNDPFYAPEGITCMNFVRVETTKDIINCTNVTDVPEPLSAVTAVIDASFLYGSSEEDAQTVRKFEGGMLAYNYRNGEYPLQDPEPQLACNVDSDTEPCYRLGDKRVNQNPQLTVLNIAYLRFHNYLARGLATVNPLWDDETLFQEARKILIAVLQHIIYNHYISGLLGDKYALRHKISHPDAKGIIDDYDPTVNPAVTNEFAACTFRSFHSDIVGPINVVKDNRNTSDTIHLADWFNKPSICEHAGHYSGLMTGLVTQPQRAPGRFMSNDVINQLFRNRNIFGQDLKAMDYQRARDQRVMSCVEARRYFNMSVPRCFRDFEEFIPPQIVAILKDVFRSPKDVDLCTCITFEKHPTSLVGDMGRAFLGEQFLRTRKGDRYFFENGMGKCPLTQEQLDVVRNSSLSQIFCINKDIKHIQADALRLISDKNPLIPCSLIPKFNFLPWKNYKCNG